MHTNIRIELLMGIRVVTCNYVTFDIRLIYLPICRMYIYFFE